VVDAVTARLATVIGDAGTGWGLVGGGGGGVVVDEDDLAPLQLERKADAATAAVPYSKRRRVMSESLLWKLIGINTPLIRSHSMRDMVSLSF